MDLYTLTGNALKIQQMIDNGEDEAKFTDTLAAIDEAIEDKAESYFYVIKNKEGEIAQIKAEEKRLADMRKSKENKIEHMKKNLENSMIQTDKKEIKGTMFTARVQRNPPSVKVHDRDNIPAVYREPQPEKINTKQMLEDLKEDENALDGVAELVQTESIRLK